MSVSQTGGSLLPIGGKSGAAMKLPLHSAGDQNGNAFRVSSSSSSSSSSSCLGESSPDSLRSLSSLSGSCLDSPLDVDMLESSHGTPRVSVSKWPTEGEGEDSKVENRDVSTESIQTVTGRSSESNTVTGRSSESNGNSVSIYLDADSGGGGDYCEDTWNDNDNLTLTTNAVRNNDDLSSSSSVRRRHRSSSPDSDATEVPVMDDDDDDDEDLFVSVSSDVALRRASTATVSSASNVPILDSLGAPDLCVLSEGVGSSLGAPDLCVLSEGGGSKSTDLQTIPSEEETAGPGSDQVFCPSELLTDGQLPDGVADDNDNIALPLASEVLGETTNTPSSASCVTKKESQLKPPLAREEVALPKSNVLTRAVKSKPSTTNLATKTASASCKPAKPEAKRAPKPDLKNVKAKVASRPSPATAKTTNQNKSAPAINEKRALVKKEEVNAADGGKRLRLATGRIKMVAVLKPVRGRGADLRTLKPNQNAKRPSQSEKRGETAVVHGALSGSSSSLGSSDVTVERPSRSPPSKAVQEMPVLNGAGEEASDAAGDAAKDPGEGSAEEIAQEMTRPGHPRRDPQREASVEKPKNRGTKVSSKLGPNARLQGKGARPDSKGASGASCNAGVAHPPSSGSSSASGPPGPGARIATQTDGSAPGKEAQGAGGEPRAKQSQNQGIPKPRAASGLAAPGCMTSNPKPPSVSQPSAAAGSGSGGRPAAAAVLSKLPVKGLPTSLSSSSLGSSASEISGAAVTAKDSTAPGAPAGGPKPEERPNRSNTIGTSAVAASAKVPGMRSRALSLQSRSTATGLKAPAVTTSHTASSKPVATSQTAVKTALSAAANQSPTKQQQQSHNPLQRSGSARLSRPNATSSTVDKNKPRGAPARPTSTSSASTQSASSGGGGASQQQAPPPDLVPELLSANTVPATPGLPVPASGTATATNAGSGTAPTSGLHVFSRARAGSRTSPKAGSRLQNGLVASSGPCSKASVVVGEASSASAPAGEAPVQVKQNHREQQQADKKNHQGINQLRRLLVQGNRRVEALATVIQHVFTEREEALRQKKQISQELVNLRDELAASSQCCERLQKEKEEVRFNLEEAVKKLEEHHKEELAQLEDRLRSFYQTEWDKVHQKYQEEADKCRLLMEQQVEELRIRQESERTKQEANHSQEIESLKQEHETSIQELKRSQQTELETLDKALKEKEASLSEQISGLLSEKESLSEKLRAEEERRRILADKSLKDSHTVYLEQELESLKVVLEIKNTQLHQKDKKLMEMGKLVETKLALEEHMNKVQQENEDYRARMDKHAALSRQLSSEQAMLQQTLQKESKVNKRLSMENEELMWKLHNGDLLASPQRRLSPTSPFQSPRHSASFPTAASLSPR